MQATAKGRVSITVSFFVLSKSDKTMRNALLFLLSMKINDENKYIIFCKRVFSDVLESVGSKNFSGGKPPDPILTYYSSTWFVIY